MNRSLIPAAAFGAAMLFALPALAGGRGVVTCPAGYAASYDSRGAATCVSINAVGGTNIDVVVADRGGLRIRLLCPYPHRPSDTVFIGGSGYLVKDDVRRANGCR